MTDNRSIEQNVTDLRKQCIDSMNDISHFYKKSFINQTGNVSGILRSEIIAECVLQQIDCFKNICPVTRVKSYNSGHDGGYNPESNQKEQIDAIKMFNMCRENKNVAIGDVGHIIDYQIPLKNKQIDVGGKIDLLSETTDTVYLVELKSENSKETLLRCVLEGYTYLRIVDKTKLFDDYSLDYEKEFKTAVLVYMNSQPYLDYIDMIKGNRPFLLKLMLELDVDFIVLKREDESYFSEKKAYDIIV